MNKLPTFPIVLAIDPSVNNLGWAAFNMNAGGERYDATSDAWRFGIVHPRARECAAQFKWWDAFAQIRSALSADGWRPTHVAIEFPAFFSSERGRIAAAQGDTLVLAGMAGYLAGRFAIPVEFVSLWTPQQWKGSVPKSVTQEKFARLYGDGARSILRQFPDDTVDAIMIADHWLSLYHREKFAWIRQWRANPNPFFQTRHRRGRGEQEQEQHEERESDRRSGLGLESAC